MPKAARQVSLQLPEDWGWLLALGSSLLLVPSQAYCDDGAVSAKSIWSTWDLTPSIVVPTLLVAIIYGIGLARRPGDFDARPRRNLAFIWGVIAVFLSLASPLDATADRLFFMHQVQHGLLRVVGPMLIAVGQPQATLTAGLPPWIRRNALAPALAAKWLRAVFAFLTRPVTVTVLFVASLYLWQWPYLHNMAILNDGVHYVMHITMLAAGLLFFWRVFDHRAPPKGTSFGVRLMMIWVAVLADIPIGAYTTFKSRELYTAYDTVGRLFHMAPMDDERLGGFIMWAPSSMMMLIALLVVIHDWATYEEKLDDRRLRAGDLGPGGVSPAVAAKLIEQQRPKNRALAWGLAAFAVCMLAATLTIGLLAMHGRPGGFAPAVTEVRPVAIVSSLH